MPTYSKTITVKEDIKTCFDFVADFRNLNKWNPHDEAELITKEPLREGSIFKVNTESVSYTHLTLPTIYSV